MDGILFPVWSSEEPQLKLLELLLLFGRHTPAKLSVAPEEPQSPERAGPARPGLARLSLCRRHAHWTSSIKQLRSGVSFKRQEGGNSRTRQSVNISLSLSGSSKIYWRRRAQVCVGSFHALTSGRALLHIPCMLTTHLLRMSICRASGVSIHHSGFNMRKEVMDTQTAASCTDFLNKSSFSSFFFFFF